MSVLVSCDCVAIDISSWQLMVRLHEFSFVRLYAWVGLEKVE